MNEMRYQVQFGDSGLHAIAGIHSAVIEALNAHFGDAEAVMRAYVRCVAAVGMDTRLPPAADAPEIDHLVADVWVGGEGLAIKRALDALWPGMDDEVTREVIGGSFLVLSPEGGPSEFDLPLPF